MISMGGQQIQVQRLPALIQRLNTAFVFKHDLHPHESTPMNITTSLFFQPSDGQPITPIDQPVDFRNAARTAITLAMAPTSPDGTYFVHHTIDVPTPGELVVPFPTRTRLKTVENALADLNIVLTPEDPRIFLPLVNRYRHVLQRVKSLVEQASAQEHV
jgi:hypothetical protein